MKETPLSKDGLAQKLRALQNMTVANGCTESEALVAAAKAAELLERYGLSLEELKAAGPDQICDSDSVHCGRRHTHEAQFLAPKIAEFTKTKIWLTRCRTEVQLTFFGLKADVQIASYLFTVFRTAMETEWTIYLASHKEEHPCHGKTVRVKAKTEGVYAHTLSMEEAGVYGWFMEAGSAGDFQKASDAFERAGAIVDRLAGV